MTTMIGLPFLLLLSISVPAEQQRNLVMFTEGPAPTVDSSSPQVEAAPPQPVPPARQADDQAPVAFYDFEGPGVGDGLVKDSSGRGPDLRVEGGTLTQTEGVHGKAVLLHGEILRGACNPLKGAEQFTVSLWFKASEPMNNYKLAGAGVWAGGNNASGWNIGTHYSEFWADNQAGSLRGGPGWDRTESFRKDEWNHLVVTYDGKRVREYINGRLSLEIAGTGLAAGEGAPLTLGSWMGGFQFHGAMDEVRIYRRALKKSEVKGLHRFPSGVPSD